MVDFPSAAELDIYAAKTTGDYGAIPTIAGIQKLRVREIDIQTQQPRIDSQELGQGRDPTPQAVGRKSTTVSLLANHRNIAGAPSGANRPELHVLLENLFGVAANTNTGGPGSSIPNWRYSLQRVQEGQMALYTHNSEIQEVNLGIALTEGVLSWNGTDPTTWRFTGVGADAHDLTPGFDLPNTDLGNYVGVGNAVRIASTNGIVSQVGAGLQLDGSGALINTGSVTDAFDAAPLNALTTDASHPHIATAGGFWYDDAATAVGSILSGTELLHTSGEIRFSPGVTLVNDQVGTQGPTGIGSPAIRQTTLTLTMRVRPGDVRLSNEIERDPSKLYACAVSLAGVRGVTARSAARMVAYMPNVQFTPGVKRRQLGQYDTLTLTGQAVGVGTAQSINLYFE